MTMPPIVGVPLLLRWAGARSPVLTCWPSFRLRKIVIVGSVPISATIIEIPPDKRMVFTDQPLPVESTLAAGALRGMWFILAQAPPPSWSGFTLWAHTPAKAVAVGPPDGRVRRNAVRVGETWHS
jgi:hypothetical protein